MENNSGQQSNQETGKVTSCSNGTRCCGCHKNCIHKNQATDSRVTHSHSQVPDSDTGRRDGPGGE